MNYYRICQDMSLPNQIRPILSKLDLFDEKPVFIEGSLETPLEYAYFPHFIERPALMVSHQVKSIWESYQTGWKYRPCALGNIQQKRIQVYWLARARLLDGLSQYTEYEKDGSLKKIVLSEEKIQFQKVFALQNLHKIYYIAEKEIVERMLQEHIHGILYQQVEVA